MVIDFRVKPPIPETRDSVARPPSRTRGYREVYSGKEENREFLDYCDGPFERFLERLAACGIDRIVCCAMDIESTYGAKLRNEVVARLQAKHPDRVIGFAGVDPHKGIEAVRELHDAVRGLGLKGLNIGPWLHKVPASDRRYYPLYAKCVELGIPVVVHTGVNFSRDMSLEFGRPLHLDTVAVEFPELTIVASHAGWPWVPEMVAVAWRHPGIFLEISGIRPRYIGMPGSGWETLLQYGNTLLRDRVLWGTDYPLIPFEKSIQDVRELPLKPEVREKWLGGNAARLLGLTDGASVVVAEGSRR